MGTARGDARVVEARVWVDLEQCKCCTCTCFNVCICVHVIMYIHVCLYIQPRTCTCFNER